MATIEFCASNLKQNRMVWSELEKIPGLELVDYGCLGYCGNCYTDCFAIVDGVLVSADNQSDLIERIIQQINL